MFILIYFKYIWCIWETKGSDSYVVKQEIDGVSGLKLTSYKLARIFNVDDKLMALKSCTFVFLIVIDLNLWHKKIKYLNRM